MVVRDINYPCDAPRVAAMPSVAAIVCEDCNVDNE